MRRRDFVGLICGATLALPGSAGAQQPSKVWRIGQVIVSTPERAVNLAQALEQGLADAGYVQGRNIVLLTRFASPQPGKVEETILAFSP
jgi:putative tryptophan/tyrosine transport system substrate-binding protein